MKRHGSFTVRRLYVAWGHRDGLHLIGPRRHFHRRNPLYVSLRSAA